MSDSEYGSVNGDQLDEDRDMMPEVARVPPRPELGAMDVE